jgi:hypothetical protein
MPSIPRKTVSARRGHDQKVQLNAIIETARMLDFMAEIRRLRWLPKYSVALSKGITAGFWSGLKAFQASQNYRGRPRESSFPFVSSDTFRAIADIVIAQESPPSILLNVPFPRRSSTMMVDLGFIRGGEGAAALLQWLAEARAQAPGISLSVILHNHDWVPNRHYLEALVALGTRVFCVNVLDGINGVTPIPLGLENLTRRKNGVLDDFLLSHDLMRPPNQQVPPKSNLLFASFKVGTNPSVRGPLAEKIVDSRFRLSHKRLTMRENRRQTLDSYFVVSPPGNGPDCHRTWESIYLGAVPVILEGTLAASIADKLPIWVVSDWNELLASSDQELIQKYDELIARPRSTAFFPYWLGLVENP